MGNSSTLEKILQRLEAGLSERQTTDAAKHPDPKQELPVDTSSCIGMVVPTRNRAHTLRITAPTFYLQEGVCEIVFIDDAGDDDTQAVLVELADSFPNVRTQVLRNAERRGASACRNQGVAALHTPYVLFCDDDEMLEVGYAQCCLRKLSEHGAGAVSGRRVYMLDGESPEAALRRFGTGMRRTAPFRPWLCEYVNGANFLGDREMPFTNAVILTPTELVRRFGFDPHYARGNGYREETDYQMNLFVNGYKIFVTNAAHSIHLSPAQIRTGGQRGLSRRERVQWSIRYTDYFYRKYWQRYATRTGVRLPQFAALTCFAVFSVYREFLRPYLYSLLMRLLTLRQRRQSPTPLESRP